MKLFLYEPGDVGHRPVILTYTIKILSEANIKWVYDGPMLSCSAFSLVKRAAKAKCDVIYFLTADGIPTLLLKTSILAKYFGIRTICTYYLFNNLIEGWKALIWNSALRAGIIDRVHVSDLQGLRDGIYPRQAHYLPDPWDPESFPVRTQEECRRTLHLSSTATIFLMFGTLDERKGADLLLQAFRILNDSQSIENIQLLLAGSTSPAIRQLISNFYSDLRQNLTLTVHDMHIPEESVSAYYFAADYLVCAYPSSFKVASNTVTRGLAAGRPIIAPSHGTNAQLIGNADCGFIFTTSDAASLASTLLAASTVRNFDVSKYRSMAAHCCLEATKRTLEVYKTQLLKSIYSESSPESRTASP